MAEDFAGLLARQRLTLHPPLTKPDTMPESPAISKTNLPGVDCHRELRALEHARPDRQSKRFGGDNVRSAVGILHAERQGTTGGRPLARRN